MESYIATENSSGHFMVAKCSAELPSHPRISDFLMGPFDMARKVCVYFNKNQLKGIMLRQESIFVTYSLGHTAKVHLPFLPS